MSTELWYRAVENQNSLTLNPIHIGSNPMMTASVALSIVLGIIFALISILVCKLGILHVNDQLLVSSVHIGNYSRSDQKALN